MWSINRTGKCEKGCHSNYGCLPVLLWAFAFHFWKNEVFKIAIIFSAGVVPVALYYFVFRESLHILRDSIEYKRRSILGSRAIVTARDSVLAVHIVKSRLGNILLGPLSRTFQVEIRFSDDRLPGGIKLFETFHKSKSCTVAEQIAAHLLLPIKDET